MRIVSFLFLLFIILLGVTFALLNRGMVTIHYYFGQSLMPLSLLLVIALIIGCLLGILVGFYLLIKAKIKNYQLSKQLKLVEKEVENLRAIPLKE